MINPEIRPNRITDVKDENYHLRMARWAASSVNSTKHQEWIKNCLINWNFYKGGKSQWILEEDLAQFFLDSTGNARNRIRMSQNMIKPIVLQFEGNSIRLTYNAKATSINDGAATRIDEQLAKAAFYHEVIKIDPSFEKALKSNFPMGETMDETRKMIESNPVDDVEELANMLIEYYERSLNIENIKVRLSRYLALTGLPVFYGYEHNGRYTGDVIPSWQFFWDHSAQKPDFSDSEFMGHWGLKSVINIIEENQHLGPDIINRLEVTTANTGHNDTDSFINGFYFSGGSKVVEVITYWIDQDIQEYGYVKDEHNYVSFERLNYKHKNEKEPRYTKKDLVPVSELTEAQKKRLNGKNHGRIYIDELRFCKFIPGSIGFNSGLGEDIVLDYGPVYYEERKTCDPDTVKYPYKVYPWIYENGEVLSPIDDLVDPQRMINRIISVQESHFNNANPAGPVIAREATSSDDTEVISDIMQGKPIMVNALKFGGVNNAIGQYASNLGATLGGTDAMLKQMESAIEKMSAVNGAMTGTGGSSEDLVGVIQERINRGMIVQEPFYYALSNVLIQIYDQMVTLGRDVAIENPKRLAVMVGDKMAKLAGNITKLNMEDFRIFIQRSEGEKTLTQQGDEFLWMLLNLQLIDSEMVSSMMGRSTVDQVITKWRSVEKQRKIIAERNEKANAEAQQKEQQMQEAERNADIESKLAATVGKNEVDALKIDAQIQNSRERNQTSIERDAMKIQNK
jgi:hypothetical protein